MIDREDVRFGDVLLYETFQGTVNCRVLALLTKYCSVSVVGLSSCAVGEIVGLLPDSFKPVTDSWDEWFAKNESRIELEWGDLGRAKSPLTIVSLYDSKPTFDEHDSAWFKVIGHCPRCGDIGAFVSLGLVCPWHGIFI